MKHNLITILCVLICFIFTSNYSMACEGCLHECNDYTKHIKKLEEPDKSIALGLWFGAYSTQKIIDRPDREPSKRINVDDRIRQYYKFWNKHADNAMVTEQDKVKLYFDPDDSKKITIPLPDKNETATVHIATKETSRDQFDNFSDFLLNYISVNDPSGKDISVKLAIKLFLVDIQTIGGKLESGWGTTTRSAKPFVEKVIEVNATNYDLNLKDFFYKNVKRTDKLNFVGIVMQATVLKVSNSSGSNSGVQLVISQEKKPDESS